MIYYILIGCIYVWYVHETDEDVRIVSKQHRDESEISFWLTIVLLVLTWPLNLIIRLINR